MYAVPAVGAVALAKLEHTAFVEPALLKPILTTPALVTLNLDTVAFLKSRKSPVKEVAPPLTAISINIASPVNADVS